jgi:hypothetical protein
MKPKDWRPTSFIETAPGAMGDDEADAGRVEQRHALHGLLGHVMTIDALALVLVASLIEKAFAQPTQRIAVAVAVAAFFLSLVFGSVAYLVSLASGPRAGALRTPASNPLANALTSMATLLGPPIGLGALGWFFLANWLR